EPEEIVERAVVAHAALFIASVLHVPLEPAQTHSKQVSRNNRKKKCARRKDRQCHGQKNDKQDLALSHARKRPALSFGFTRVVPEVSLAPNRLRDPGEGREPERESAILPAAPEKSVVQVIVRDRVRAPADAETENDRC